MVWSVEYGVECEVWSGSVVECWGAESGVWSAW